MEPASATPIRWRGRGRVALLAAALTLALATPFGVSGGLVRSAAAAEIVTIYRYVDEDGVVHLTDKPKGDTRYRVFGQRDLGVSAPFDADANVEGGVRYLKSLMDRFGDLPLALAAYNAGPERVARHGGIPPIPETQQYVTKVMDTYARLSR